MLVRTGLRAALAAEMVSFWICRRDVLFDRFSAAGLPSAPAGDGDGDGEAADADAAAAAEGSAVMRSMSVVPDESCPNNININIKIKHSQSIEGREMDERR